MDKDYILKLNNSVFHKDDKYFASNKWLRNSCPKRLIYHELYGDILNRAIPLDTRVLDVGGGYTSLTRILLKNCRYSLLDIMAHDSHEKLLTIESNISQKFWINDDWFNFEPGTNFDLIIANDIFPNVDQRLGVFLEKYLPVCFEIRLLLTYHNTPHWYKARRLDGEEIFHMMAWDGVQTTHVINSFLNFVIDPDLRILLNNPPSLFDNGRQVCLITFRGGVKK